MKRLLIGLCAATLAACSGSSTGSSGSTSTGSTTSTSSAATSGTTSSGSSGSSATTSSGSSGATTTGGTTTTTTTGGTTTTTTTTTGGSGSTGSVVGPLDFTKNTELFTKPLVDDAGVPLDAAVAYLATDLTATCADLRNPDAGKPTSPFWIMQVATEATDGTTPIATGSYSWNYLTRPPDAGYVNNIVVQHALEYSDGGNHAYVALSGTIDWTAISGSDVSGTYQGQLIDYTVLLASGNTMLVDAGQITGTFGNIPYCGP